MGGVDRPLVFSGELGIAKPDDAIYAAVTAALDVDASEVVFFDDRQVNVDAARRAGWDAHLWTSGETVRDTLRTMGLLPREAEHTIERRQ